MFRLLFIFLWTIRLGSPDVTAVRQCQQIKIDICRDIGYNQTAMPNWVGHELQSDVEFTLQTFIPLIEYVCSTQLKLFLCAAYVPMCTPKVPVPIGPCRSLCESVRSRCHPILQGFGFPWPPALDCQRFPRVNNHETMCIEVPDEAGGGPVAKSPEYVATAKAGGAVFQCPGYPKNHRYYVKSHRSDRCAPLCEANILFGENDKNFAEAWSEALCYSALGLALVAWFVTCTDSDKQNIKWSQLLLPLVWCHDMVVVGWSVRFVAGRTATACGYDPQFPNVAKLLLVDGLSNPACAATFILRYYFGMAAYAWWAILCLAWHRDLRSCSPDQADQLEMASVHTAKRPPVKAKQPLSVTQSNFARFVAWGLPAFQTMAVIVSRLVDADELLGSCFVGNQSDKGLQVLVATPVFCYWIFGSMNLVSGYLVHRRNKQLASSQKSPPLHHSLAPAQRSPPSNNSGVGVFLCIYCVPLGILLLAVIYEFANIDVWLNAPVIGDPRTPLWPFLARVFSEIMLSIICFAWILGPKISKSLLRQNFAAKSPPKKPAPPHVPPAPQSSRSSNVAYSTVSYQTIRMQAPPVHQQTASRSPLQASVGKGSKGSQLASHSPRKKHSHAYDKKSSHRSHNSQLYRYGDETIL